MGAIPSEATNFMETLLKRVSFIGDKKVKRNTWLFDAGLHTLHIKPKKGEMDVRFVERFLVKFAKGCQNRAKPRKPKKFVFTVEEDDDYVTVWEVK